MMARRMGRGSDVISEIMPIATTAETESVEGRRKKSRTRRARDRIGASTAPNYNVSVVGISYVCRWQ